MSKPARSLTALSAALVLSATLATAQAQSLRPELGKPLQQASELLKAGKAREAMAKVKEADVVGAKNTSEMLLIERMRASAAQRLGDQAMAARAFETIFPKVSGNEAAQIAEQLAYTYANLRDVPKATQWLQKAQSLGSNNAGLRQLQSYLQSQSGDYGAIAKESAAAVSTAEQAGRRPEENELLRLADAQLRLNNKAGQTATLEKLLTHYPKNDYWAIYLDRVQRKPGFSSRFALDLLRLKLELGLLEKSDDYMEMAQLALQAGLPAEGKAIVDKGFAAGVLNSSANGGRQQRLRDLANQRNTEAGATLEQRSTSAAAAKDGNELVSLGYAYVTRGQGDKGIALIEQGIATGKLKRPEDAKLQLGQALLLAKKPKNKAVQVFRSVKGDDGAADMGRLWALFANTRG